MRNKTLQKEKFCVTETLSSCEGGNEFYIILINISLQSIDIVQ